MSEHDSDTVENISPALAAAKYFVDHTDDLAYEFGAASHAGLKRPENQDHYLVLRRVRTQQLLLTNMPTEELVFAPDETFGMAVADGMAAAADAASSPAGWPSAKPGNSPAGLRAGS